MEPQEQTLFDRNVLENGERIRFYKSILVALNRGNIPFLLGGAYAYECYTGVHRDTKDLDIFVRRSDCTRVMDFLSKEGYQVEMTHHWLGKIFLGEWFIDVIFSSANGICEVDDIWFQYAVSDSNNAFGMTVQLIPVEEMIWSKGFIMEKERYDGADINHLIRSHGNQHIDWLRLLNRFGKDHWRVLFSHLVLFGFVYPEDRTRCIPLWVIQQLTHLMQQECSSCSGEKPASVPSLNDMTTISTSNNEMVNILPIKVEDHLMVSVGVDSRGGNDYSFNSKTPPLCNGTLVSRAQYLTDVHKWGYKDGRLKFLNREDIVSWTRKIPELDIFDPDVVRKGIETPSPTDT